MKLKSNRVYARLLLYFIIIVSLTIILQSSILYMYYEDILRDKIYTFIIDDLGEISQNADFMATSAKTLSMQVYYNLNISKILLYEDPGVVKVNTALNQLVYFGAISPSTYSIYAYNNATETFYTSPHMASRIVYSKALFYDQEAAKIVDNFRSYKCFTPIHRTIPLDDDFTVSTSAKKTVDVFTFLYYEQVGENEKLDSLVFINVREDLLLNKIKDISQRTESDIYVLDNSMDVILSSREDVKSDIIKTLLGKNFFIQSNMSGYVLENIDGTKSLVTYYYIASQKLAYVCVTPYSYIAREIGIIRDKTIIIGFGILFVGLLAAFFASRMIYSPIKDIQVNLKKLQDERRNNFFEMRQDFLRGYLMESKNLNEDFDKGSNYFKIKLRMNAPVCMLLLKIDDYAGFCRQYNEEYRDLLYFSIMNIASEICDPLADNEAVSMQKGKIALVLQVKSPHEKLAEAEMDKLCLDIQQTIMKYLKLSISIIVSSETKSLDHITFLYNQAQEASFYRLFVGHQCLIYAEKVGLSNNKEFQYPVQKEKELINSLMLGKMDEVKEIYLEIINEMSMYAYPTVNFAFSRLLLNINIAINTIVDRNFQSNPFSFSSLIISLDEEEFIKDVNDKFFKVFDEIADKLKDRKVSRHEDLIKKIIGIIQENSSNPDFTLTTITDMVKMSPTYVGRLFSKITSESVVDYINHVRIDKAKVLLKGTSLTIEQISQQTGFNNVAYFYRVFKKETSVTPKEYRTQD